MKNKLCRPVLVASSSGIYIMGVMSNLIKVFSEIEKDSMWRKFGVRCNLNIISLDPDEKIEVGDWFYDTISKTVGKAKVNFGRVGDDQAKLIIASTDISLNLPQPSPGYIQQFMEEYNAGEVKDVNVEYKEEFNIKLLRDIEDVKKGELIRGWCNNTNDFSKFKSWWIDLNDINNSSLSYGFGNSGRRSLFNQTFKNISRLTLKLTNNQITIHPVIECEHPFKSLHWVGNTVFCNKCKTTLRK